MIPKKDAQIAAPAPLPTGADLSFIFLVSSSIVSSFARRATDCQEQNKMGCAQIEDWPSRVSCSGGRCHGQRSWPSSFEICSLSVLLLFLNLLDFVQAHQSEPALPKLDAWGPDCGRHNFRGFKIERNCFRTCKEKRHRRSAGELESANVTEEEEVERVLKQILESDSDEKAELEEEGSSRASAGYTTPLDEFPSFVRLKAYEDYIHYNSCGGTLIHKNVVFTAGHCLATFDKTSDYFQVVANEAPRSRPWLVKQAKNLYGKIAGGSDVHEQWANVVAACLHQRSYGPNFEAAEQNKDEKTFYALDFAILKLDRDFSYNKFVQPACFDLQRKRINDLKSTYVFAGAGLISHSPPIRSDSKITLALKERFHNCSRSYQACFETFDEKDYKGNLCQGDSGSGLFCFDTCGASPKAYVVGTASSIDSLNLKSACVPGHTHLSHFMELYEFRQVIEQCVKTLDTQESGNHIKWHKYG